MVEPFIGKRSLKNGILAIILSFAFIVCYVWYRFKQISGLAAGLSGLIALVHDCALVFLLIQYSAFPSTTRLLRSFLRLLAIPSTTRSLFLTESEKMRKLDFFQARKNWSTSASINRLPEQ